MDIGTVVKFTDRHYRGMGWRFGRIEGIHWYDQPVVDLRKLEKDENTGQFMTTGTMIYMVPGYAVEAVG